MFEVFINNKKINSLIDIKIRKSFKEIADSFTAAAVFLGEKLNFDPGDIVRINYKNKLFFTGYIDFINGSISGSQRNINIGGRSRPALLVDSTAIYKTGAFYKQNFKFIVSELLAPFGIDPVFNKVKNKTYDKFTIEQGETVFSVLDRLTAENGLIMYSNFNGDLVFNSPRF